MAIYAKIPTKEGLEETFFIFISFSKLLEVSLKSLKSVR